MPFCTECGSELPEEGGPCPSCHAPPEAGTLDTDGEPLVWSARMPVVTSPVVVKQLVIALGAGFLFVAVLMVIMGAYEALPWIGGIFLFLLVLCLIVAAAIHFFTKGGPMGEFAIGSEGVGYRAGKESKALNRATLAGSVVGGSLSGAGGSLINISRETESMSWDEMRSVTVDRRDRSLVFYRHSLVYPIALYCTEETFEPAIELVRRYAPDTTLKING